MSTCCSGRVNVELQMLTKLKKEVQTPQSELPVAIIGGGPVGLAAAAHLVSKGESFVLFEAADEIAGNMKQWSHVRLFSPWQYNIDKAAKALLEANGWKGPKDDDHPTGGELITQYLAPLSELPSLKPHIYYQAKVTAVSRKGLSKIKTADRENVPFVLHVLKDNRNMAVEAKAVIDTSGTWATPNPALSGGIWTEEEAALGSRITYGIPDILVTQRDKYAGKKVLVIGSGHSAVNALLELERLQRQVPETTVGWVIRKPDVRDVYGGQENDSLRERGQLGMRIQNFVDSGKVQVYPSFLVEGFQVERDRVTVTGSQNGEMVHIEAIDEIICNTGSRPDLVMLREVRTDIDPAIESVGALAPLIDPNIHSCGTVRPHGERELRQPEQNFYIAGSKSYGRAPTFLMATGYEQVRSIVAAITGDWEAARKVELDLPETGVCSSSKMNDLSCCAPDETPDQSQRESCGADNCKSTSVRSASSSSCCG